MVETGGLENRFTLTGNGFESLSLRHMFVTFVIETADPVQCRSVSILSRDTLDLRHSDEPCRSLGLALNNWAT